MAEVPRLGHKVKPFYYVMTAETAELFPQFCRQNK